MCWDVAQEVTGGRKEENFWWLGHGEDIAAAAGQGWDELRTRSSPMCAHLAAGEGTDPLGK